MGKSVIEQVAHDIQLEFVGIRGFSARNLWLMKQFYETYQEHEFLPPMVAEIGWSHNVVVFQKCKADLERQFYIKMTKQFGWTKNVLIHQIDNKTYEKYLLNQTNFDQTLPEAYQHQAILAVKDEYQFDFLELFEKHAERELERFVAITRTNQKTLWLSEIIFLWNVGMFDCWNVRLFDCLIV